MTLMVRRNPDYKPGYKPDFKSWLHTPGIRYFSSTSDNIGGPFLSTVHTPIRTFEGDARATRRAAEQSASNVALWHMACD